MNDETVPEAQTQSVTQPEKHKVRKKKRAKCWKEFTDLGLQSDGKERAQCHYCGIKIVIDGTTTLNRHLRLCPDKPRVEDKPKYDHKTDREMSAEIIIYHDLPFKYVEYEKVRARDRFLNRDCQHICRQTVALDVYRKYELEKIKLIEVLAKHKGRVSFTSDLWSARSVVMGYLCLTAHYIDESWTLINKILVFSDFKPPHTGEAIAKKIYDSLKEWGLEKKVFTITLDNASANNSMQNLLKHRLQSGLLCDGKFLHWRCSAHILNLIVQSGLEVAGSLLENIRASVKFLKASESRLESFATCVQSLGIKSSSGLSLDVSIRWNSTFEMLARALKFRKAFSILHLYERDYSYLPSEEEWDRGEKIFDLLKPFNTITTYFSGVKYPTADVYFLQVWRIEMLLKKYVSVDCDDVDVRAMAEKMHKKFAKYWDQYSIILAMGAALDPRLKLKIIESAYEKIDPITANAKVELVRKNLELFYKEYSSASVSKPSTTMTPLELLNESPLEDDMDHDLFELENSLTSGSTNTKSNLEIYLDDEPRLEMKTFSDIEILSFWKENHNRYGDLAAMASDLLSIPITTVASESAFSIGGRVLNPFRNRLLAKNVQALILTRNWLRGFAEFEGDIEDYLDDGDNDATQVASSSGVEDSNN